MITRGPKRRESTDAAPEIPEITERLSQSKRPEAGRFLLQVDRQTKGSYTTAELAESAGMVIKTGYPHVQVSIYDSAEGQNAILELPAATK